MTQKIPLTTVRTYDGSQNNLNRPAMNKSGEVYQRKVEPEYADSYDAPSGQDRPNPRAISNAVAAQDKVTVDERKLSAFSWTWGQFLDHDMVLTPNGGRPDFSVKVPAGDPHFDPMGGGKAIIPLARSLARIKDGRREQFNANSGWIDASMVYGSDPERAKALRSFEGGKLKEGSDGLLPYNVEGLDNEDPFRGDPARLFLAGDRRANENLALTSLHTLFLREHNRLAEELSQRYPDSSDEEIFQAARKVVGAQIQKITYDEFLPSLLGDDALPDYEGYKPDTDASISNLFTAAAFRMGHSQVGRAIRRIEENGDEIEHGHLCLKAGFHQAPRLAEEGGIDPILRGLSEYLQEATDLKVVDDLRNFLFGRPGHGGLDLAAINIQRGRDHGLGPFNKVQEAFGFQPHPDIASLAGGEKQVQASLEKIVPSVDKLDPWVGFLAERHEPGASVGPTLKAVLSDQFTRLRDGDRFFYKNDPDVKELCPDIEDTRLVDIIKRNTEIENIQEDLFLARDGEPFDDPCRS